MKDFSKLEKKIEVEFSNQDLLKSALVHRSYLNENPKFPLSHNERLEFLGDAVLEFSVTEYLFRKFSKKPEGELTNLRSSLVNSKTLSGLAEDLGLEEYLYLSKGERQDTGKARRQILANTIEALIGAIYLDKDYIKAKEFIGKKLLPLLPRIIKEELYLDSKSSLQEIIQDKFRITPEYKVISETGPDHDRRFEVGIYLNKKLVAKGKGSSKQDAQMKAAEEALKVINKKDFSL